jgi:hypothetical protein
MAFVNKSQSLCKLEEKSSTEEQHRRAAQKSSTEEQHRRAAQKPTYKKEK